MKKLFGYYIVLTMPLWAQSLSSPDINSQPTRQFGHPSLQIPPTQNTPNLVEGRELYAPGQMAFDSNGNLYVADIGNNRILAFKPGSAVAGHMADLVIGQEDFQSTLGQGSPRGTFTTGINSPAGIAVDPAGNLYVADAGNNRILRFPTPFAQNTVPLQPDLVIGQKTFNSGNLGNMNGNCAANTLYLSANGSAFIAGLAIDASGNLWAVDPLNNRVLMYPAASLTPNAPLVAATGVVGQNSLTSCSLPSGVNAQQISLTGLAQPSSLAFDASGGLYIADGYSRVLYYAAPIASQGQVASRVLGVSPQQTQGQPLTTYPNQYSLGGPGLSPPNGVFTLGNHVFVADTGANRILEYDVPVNWPSPTTISPSPPALTVIGQSSFGVGTVNQAQAHASQYTLSSPYAGVFSGNTLWVADTGNNRLLAYPPSNGVYSGATNVVGQTDFIYNAPNLIEGKELYLTASSMVIDNSSTPPHLYVADPGNNRILCFKDARIVGQTTPPAPADLVIGQPDFKTSEVNYPTGLATTPSPMGLNGPIGVVVDNNGNLYVADSGNGRVLRFASPFNQNLPLGTPQSANLVLGQPSFTSSIQNATANSMHTPFGLALFADTPGAVPLTGSLAVSDPVFNRVLIFKKQAGGDFTNGESASVVFGQPNFTGFASNNTFATFNSPRGIASDTSDRLYVADSLNNRIMEFIQAPEQTTNGITSVNQLTAGISQPQGVAVNSLTTELWVANSGGGQLLRFPEFVSCELASCTSTAAADTAPAAPLGVTLDLSGNVIAGDNYNHLTFFFAQAFYKNAATFSAQQPLAPGMIAVLARLGLRFNISSSAKAQTLPWPTTLSDLNLTVSWPGSPAAGVAAPIYATDAGYGAIYFQVPGTAPTSGMANFVVTQASTGAVLGVGQFQMAQAAPGFFTASANGLGPVQALNIDSKGNATLNTSANPVPRGGTIALFLTGQGQVVGGPPVDGAAPTAALMTATLPTVIINGTAAVVTYSGLGGGYPGLWQVNVTVPSPQPIPNQANSIALSYLGVQSNIGGNPNSAPDGTPGPDVKPIPTTIWIGN